MATTLPVFSQTIDNAFTETWYEMRSAAADNILNSTVVWALLKMKGCFESQRGGKLIERTIKYGVGPTPIAVGKGDTLPTGEIETETAAFWRYQRAVATHIQRSLFDDTENAGKFQIKNYVTKRTTEAMDAMKQKLEGDVLRTAVVAETGKEMQGLGDIIPAPGIRATGTFGGIARPTTYSSDLPTVGNVWWSPRYKTFNLPVEVNLVSDMRTFFNTVGNQQEMPDTILTTQTLYEMYEDFGLEAIQFLGNQKILNLGFGSLLFKGADLTYSPNMATSATIYDGTSAAYSNQTHAMLFLTSAHIRAIYDPALWFMMTNWKEIYNQSDRLAHIITRVTLICDQLRRQGLLYL